MVEPVQFASSYIVVPPGETYDPFATLTALRQLEIQTNMAELRALQGIERRNRFVLRMVDCWPIAAGLLLGAISPAMQALIDILAPWAMPIVFPFVVLASRPELHLSGYLGHLPLFMLYAQFPLEMLLAKTVLNRRIKISGVAVQISFYHFLGVMQILLVTGVFHRFLVH